MIEGIRGTGCWSERSVVCPILVGRADNLHLLDALAARTRAGQGGIVLVAGEAGIGKSRLIAETRARVATDEELSASAMRFLQGACFEPDHALPYSPFQNLLRGLVRAQGPAEVRRVMGAVAPELVKIVPELVALLPDLTPSPASTVPTALGASQRHQSKRLLADDHVTTSCSLNLPK